MNYQTVCGLEVHVELATESKVFCSCSTRFGGAPNSRVCEICTGMPGTLPTLNEKVVAYAVTVGLALHCDVMPHARFDRKNYFYPDLPKAYQISQLYLPICRNGWVEIDDSQNGGKKKIRIHEMHIEEDAGKLIHDSESHRTLINYNRCGVPLLEIVSEPDIASPEEAAAFAEKLRAILRFCGVSDCKMQEGSLRADVNVSVKPEGATVLGTRTEMKNINSFKAIRRAVATEAARQTALLENGGRVVQETRRWDEKSNTSHAMRSKEEANDYRYFPEPDLPPLELTDAYIQAVRDSMPELPEEKQKRYMAQGVSEQAAALLCEEPPFAALYETTFSATGRAQEAANWITVELVRVLREQQTAVDDMAFNPHALGEILNLLHDGAVSRDAAKEVLEAVVRENADVSAYIAAHHLELVSDEALIAAAVDEVLATQPKAVKEYREGKEKAFRFLVGQTMRLLKGKASATAVSGILLDKLQ